MGEPRDYNMEFENIDEDDEEEKEYRVEDCRIMCHYSMCPRGPLERKHDQTVYVAKLEWRDWLNERGFFTGSPFQRVDILVHYMREEAETREVLPRFKQYGRIDSLDAARMTLFARPSIAQRLTLGEYQAHMRLALGEILLWLARKYQVDPTPVEDRLASLPRPRTPSPFLALDPKPPKPVASIAAKKTKQQRPT